MGLLGGFGEIRHIMLSTGFGPSRVLNKQMGDYCLFTDGKSGFFCGWHTALAVTIMMSEFQACTLGPGDCSKLWTQLLGRLGQHKLGSEGCAVATVGRPGVGSPGEAQRIKNVLV